VAIRTFSDEEKKEIKEQATRFWDDSTNEMREYFLKFNDFERMSRGLLPAGLEAVIGKYKDRSSVAPADIYVNIEQSRAAINDLVFGSKPYGHITRPGQPRNLDEMVQTAEMVLQRQNDLGNEPTSAGRCIHQALVGGLGASITRWVDRTVNVPVRKELGEWDGDGRSAKLESRTVHKYADSLPLDIRHVRLDPNCDRLEDRRIVGRQYLRPLHELIALNNVPWHFYSFDAEKLRRSSFDQLKYYEFTGGERDALKQRKDKDQQYADKLIAVREHRGLFRIKTGPDSWEVKDLIVDIGNEDEILGIKENDLPIAGWDLYDFVTVDNQLGRKFPMGLIEPAFDMWFYLFLIFNHIIDREQRDIYDMYVADKQAANELPDYMPFEMGKLIKIDTQGLNGVAGAIAPLRKAASSQGSFELASIISKIIQQIMKLNDYVQSGSPDRRETATAVEALVQGGRSLLLHMIEQLRASYFEPAWQKKLRLWNFFQQENREITGWDGRQGQYIAGLFDSIWFDVEVDTRANQDKPTMVRRLIEMFPILMNNPVVDQEQLIRTAWNVIQLPDKDRVIRNNDMLEMAAHKENMALIKGIQLPVHPAEPHTLHLEVHQVVANTPVGMQHIKEHQMNLQRQTVGLGNTKEMGGNSGQQIGSTLPAIQGRTGQGYGLPGAGRR
jgi:hypothetical protein